MDWHLAVRILGVAILAFFVVRFVLQRIRGPREDPYAMARVSEERFELATVPDTASVPATEDSDGRGRGVAVKRADEVASGDLVFFDTLVQAPLAETWRAMTDLSLLPFVHQVRVVSEELELSNRSGDLAWTSDSLREGVLVRLSGSFLVVLIRFSAVARLAEVIDQHTLALDFPRQEPEFLVSGNRPVEGQLEFTGRAVFELAPQGDKTLLRVALAGAYFTDNGDTVLASEDLGRQYRSYFKRYAKVLAKRAKRS